MQPIIFQDQVGQTVTLTLNPQSFSKNPGHVFVVPLYEDQWLLTFHQERGYEFPGGKVESGERTEDAVRRETWEETGATVGRIEQIGEYHVQQPGMQSFHKAIYLAEVLELHELPAGFETTEAKLFPRDIDVQGEQFSFLMKDAVFTEIQKLLITYRPFLHRMK
jgi:8-oxo-dGTP diphosphatase